MSEPQKTPLAKIHENMGGKMVDFAGWYMPVEFSGLRKEHLHVREKVGLFDVSHMGEIRILGDKALETVEWLTTNYVAQLEPCQAQYTLLPNNKGGLVDDLIVYCEKKGSNYLLCVNASNKDKDLQWIEQNNRGATVVDESGQWGQIAIQGPQSGHLIHQIFVGAKNIKPFYFSKFDFNGDQCLVAATGYTGEEGFEVFVPWGKTAELWQKLLEVGQDIPVKPIGLGARDTLRTEMKYSLYGHEITDETNPYAAGLGWVVKPKLKDFLGRERIVIEKEQGLPQKLIGFKMLDRGIARQGYSLFSFDNKEIGKVTSGTPSPSLGENIGIAYIDKELAEVGQEFWVEIRARKVKAQVIKTPFITKY